MMLLRLALQSLSNRRVSAFLCVLTVAFSSALLLGVEHIRANTKQSFQSTLSGTDLIVGARTGAVPLMLYTVFHVGEASNNVSWESYQRYANLPSVAWSIPISLGDSYQGFRVVGTTDALFQHYRFGAKRALSFASGRAFDNIAAEAVVGASVAAKLKLTLGSKLTVAHGIGNVGFVTHTHAAQTLVGILNPTGTPIDQSVFVNLQAIEDMHAGFDGSARQLAARPAEPGSARPASDSHSDGHSAVDGHSHSDAHGHSHDDSDNHDDSHSHSHSHDDSQSPNQDDGHSHDDSHAAKAMTPKAITAFFLGLKVRPMALALQRQINEDRSEPLLAILPTPTLQQLWRLLGVAENALRLVAMAVVLTGLLGMMMALWSTLEQRRREMAILRSVGAKGRQIFLLLVAESALLTLLGLCLGGVLLSGALYLLAPWVAAQYGLFLAPNWLSTSALSMLAMIFAVSIVLAFVPAVAAYRSALADGLSIRL
jgi:putative ABC transport system permease protein